MKKKVKPRVIHKTEKTVIGWREWVSLPLLGIPSIKAKIDTGARTSALHAFKIEPVIRRGKLKVRFFVHPLQRSEKPEIECIADVVDMRTVIDSGGKREKRFVINTPVHMGDSQWDIEVTLTDRKDMLFRMLLGRSGLRGHMIVDPGRSFLGDKGLAHYYSRKR
jgi:hypothetical protein